MEQELAKLKVAHRAYLLRQAQEEEEKGNPLQALDLYFQLLQYFPNTPEAQTAKERLLNLAQRWENEGKDYSAQHIRHRLEEHLKETGQ